MLPQLPSAPTVLGWLATYLVHSTLWLASAWLVARLVRSPAWRERLWKGAVLGGLASTTVVVSLSTSSVAWSLPEPLALPIGESAGAPIVLQLPAEASTAPAAVDEPARAASTTTIPVSTADRDTPARVDWAAWTVALWLVGAALGLARLAWLHARLRRGLASRRPVRHGPLRAQLERLRERVGRRRATRLSVSPTLASPIALARGEIVVPERALAQLSERELEALLAHELAHLERGDPLWLVALSVLERALFVQPLNRVATTRSMQAAELACDELAARWTRGEVELARCLAEVASWSGPVPSRGLVAGLSERPSALVERVERLLAPPAAPRRQGLLVGAWLAGGLLALACAGPHVTPARAQEPGEPRIVGWSYTPPEDLGLEFVGGARLVAQPSDPSQDDSTRKELEARIRRYIAKQEEAREGRMPDEVVIRARILDEQVTQAIDVLDDCPEAGIAFHVHNWPFGVNITPMAVRDHALELRADRSIWCGEMRLLAPGASDDRLLAFHLAEIARCMPHAPLSADHPDGPSLPDGRLELRIDEQAPHALLQRVLQTCGTKDVLIWRLSLVPVRDGQLGEALPFALPRDVGVAASTLQLPQWPLAVRMRVLDAGSRADPSTRVLEYEAGMTTAVLTSEEGLETPVRESRTTTERRALREFLEGLQARFPRARVVLDARPGTVYADVVALIDDVVAAGFTDITFVGERMR